MPLIMNASSQEHQVRVYGAWFTFAPGQIKLMDNDKVFHLSTKCAYLGFVALPEEFEDLEYKGTEAGKLKLEELRAKGVESRIQHLESLKANELQSLKSDVKRKDNNAEASGEMSSSTLKMLEAAAKELKSYKVAESTEGSAKAEKLKAIEELFSE